MTPDWDTPPTLKGRVELIEQRGFVTRTLPADRIAQAYRPGRLWRAKAQMPPDDEAGRLPRRIAFPLLLLLSAGLWIIVVSAAFGIAVSVWR